MRYLIKFLLPMVMLFFITLNAFACEDKQSEELKKWFIEAITYGDENLDPNQDYSKYVSKEYIAHTDGQTFNYEQWVQHMKDIKANLKSFKISFIEVITQGDSISANFISHLEKKDGSKLDVKVLEFFKVKNHKLIYGDELTRLISGNAKDKDIGSTK